MIYKGGPSRIKRSSLYASRYFYLVLVLSWVPFFAIGQSEIDSTPSVAPQNSSSITPQLSTLDKATLCDQIFLQLEQNLKQTKEQLSQQSQASKNIVQTSSDEIKNSEQDSNESSTLAQTSQQSLDLSVQTSTQTSDSVKKAEDMSNQLSQTFDSFKKATRWREIGWRSLGITTASSLIGSLALADKWSGSLDGAIIGAAISVVWDVITLLKR